MLTTLQSFDIRPTLPSMYSIAAAVAIPGILRGSSGVFKQYGLAGELVRTGGIAVAFGCQL
jgi:oligosaccharide translocation protein RFT1